jgi:2-oxoisovalerate dehydrogenase E1 component
MTSYPAPDRRIALGDVGIDGDGTDLAIISYANGYFLSTQASKALKENDIDVRLIDMRWLAPMPIDALLEATKDCKNVLIVDECRSTGSQSEGLMAMFAEAGRTRVARVTAQDSFIATGPAYAATLPSTAEIIAAATTLVAS